VLAQEPGDRGNEFGRGWQRFLERGEERLGHHQRAVVGPEAGRFLAGLFDLDEAVLAGVADAGAEAAGAVVAVVLEPLGRVGADELADLLQLELERGGELRLDDAERLVELLQALVADADEVDASSGARLGYVTSRAIRPLTGIVTSQVESSPTEPEIGS
jgi:hypothetical protein